ncbi:hypothetical protein HF313_13930 [Massilia atriviolacea]|uniref:Cold-shock protein n=1 Tax=Massilia atriviolacea TaxID=2495579 RepID=A0A430HQP1_9BURK|nr:hypothetical protein [Massilia atriviolacea]RSZ59827.1 hypothetical protein EJB06_06460 [Massilia atriviolacea]
MSAKKAILSRITPDGLGYLVDKRSHEIFHFTFDKIPNYRGESTEQLGLVKGDDVSYESDDDGQVTKVIIPIRSSKKMFAW